MFDVNKRSLFFLYIVTFLMFTEFFVYQTVTPLYILSLGGNEFFSGIQSTLFFIAAIILRFYFGPLADEKGNKLVLLIGVFVFMTAPLLFLLSENMIYIVLVRIYQSIGLATYCSSASSLTSMLAPQNRIGAYIGIHRLIIMSSLMIGPSVTLQFVAKYGYSAFHIMGIIEGLIALAFLFCVIEPRTGLRSDQETVNGVNVSIFYKMLTLLKEKQLNYAYRYIFIVSFVEALVLSFGSIFVSDSLPSINPGILFTFFGLGSVAGSLASGIISDFKSKNFVASSCMLILGLGIVALAFLPVIPILLCMGGIMAGFGFSGTLTALIPMIIQSAKISERTTALSLQESANDIGVASGSLVFGIMIPFVGNSYTFVIGGSLLLVLWLFQAVNHHSVMKKQ